MLFNLRNISYTYAGQSKEALKGIKALFESSHITGLAGQNGGGKTTLIKILLQRLLEYSGQYSIDSNIIVDCASNIASQFGIGYAPDIPALEEEFTGLEIMEIVNELRGGSSISLQKELEIFCDYMGVDNWIKEKKCSEYSAGMRKKVSIGIAYCGPVKYVILDEPVNGLDPISIVGLRKFIQHKKDCGIGTLVSSHILDFIEKIVDNILLLKSGDQIFWGNLSELKTSNPQKDLEEIYFTLYHNK